MPNAIEAIVARHKARLLDNLEQVNCPDIYHAAVKNELSWLQDDIRIELHRMKQDGELKS
jgi:hypothetical protein